MVRCSIVSLLVVLICSSINADNDWTKFPANDLYPADKSDCVFPFTYQGRTYTDCTNDGDNGLLPWCSLTSNYQGVFTYCYDFRNPKAKCLDWYTINRKNYTGCQLLSKSSIYKQCRSDHSNYTTIYCPDAMNKPKSNFPKRRRDCDPGYQRFSKDHTMCFAPSDFAIPVAISDTEKQELLDMHNNYRANVSSKHMFKLYWDDELAKLAQARSDLCGFDHDLADNRRSLVYNWKNGQNMVMSSEIRSSLANLIDMMLGSEKQNFRYGVGCEPEGTCLHYTQAMISNLTRVGCAHTHCVYPDRIERFLVCNYIESQYAGKYPTPYVQTSSAEAGSACPSKKDGTGLCDCGNKICQYDKDEYIEPDTCQCKVGRSKRSLSKRDVHPKQGFVAIPGGHGAVETARKKRSFRTISKPDGSRGKPDGNRRGQEQDLDEIDAIDA